ncbi:MAG TPA: protein kinase [Acidobacteriota bacterium]|nr:protein kinase [Acidobacteriota bacterium]
MEPDDDKTQTHVVLTQGTQVGHYKIIEKIGAGGMGEVYLAEDTELGRKVALKFLPPHLCQEEDCRKRFKREAQAAAKLSHPNIIHVYEVSEHQGRPFFAMEHVEGRSLREFSAEKDLPIEQILELGIQICEGVHDAHEKGVTHRDIKPSNILIDSHGRAKIVDFGLASVVGSDQLTRTGSTLGTVGYMSPEQVQGKPIDHRSDLFSLGVVLYELITKQNPFKRDSEAATLKAVSDDTAHPMARYRADVPDGLQAIIDKALEKDVKTRYQHADGMLSDLMRIKRSLESGQSAISVSSPDPHLRQTWWGAGALIVIVGVVAVLLTKPWSTKTDADRSGTVMLAVLPFENLGDPEDEYFADGVTEEITTSLARLSGLGVISRTSAIQYKDTDKSLRQIGKELKVDYVLEGTIRWDKSGANNRVRINPQLIRVADDLHLWADRYDAILMDIFAVQSTIAREVAAALDVALLQSERIGLADRPEVDPKAYDYYLRGKQYFSIARYRQDELRTAEQMHLKAIELAPAFAPPYAELGGLYTEIHWDGIDTTQIILDSAKALIDIAVGLAPESPEPYQALGWYYYHGLHDFDRALDAFSTVLQRQPNNSLAIASVAWVERRQGKWEKAVDGLLRAVQLDPREPWYYHELGNTYNSSHRFEQAIVSYEQAIDLEPDNEWAFFGKSWAVLNATGDPEAALQVINEGFVFSPRSASLIFLAVYCNLCTGNYQRALDLMTGPKDVFLWQYQDGVDYYYMKGMTYALMQQPDVARPYLDSARIIIESMVSTDPDVAADQSYLGKIYAALGRNAEAIAAARRGVELLPVSIDALDGPDRIWDLATVYTRVGERDLAIDQLDSLFLIPSEVSVNWLKIAPEFIPLRDHPRFQALIEKYEKEHGT